MNPETAKNQAVHAGQSYFSAQTDAAASSSPIRRATQPEAARAPAALAGTIYTRPICGTTLDPVLVTAESEPSKGLVDMITRFWIGLVVALPVVTFEMRGQLAGLDHLIGQGTPNWAHVGPGRRPAGRAEHSRHPVAICRILRLIAFKSV